jgi:hypothetical protein
MVGGVGGEGDVEYDNEILKRIIFDLPIVGRYGLFGHWPGQIAPRHDTTGHDARVFCGCYFRDWNVLYFVGLFIRRKKPRAAVTASAANTTFFR